MFALMWIPRHECLSENRPQCLCDDSFTLYCLPLNHEILNEMCPSEQFKDDYPLSKHALENHKVTICWFSRSLADFDYQRSDEEVVHLLGEPELKKMPSTWHIYCLTRMHHIQYLQHDDLTRQRTGCIREGP